jgi:carbon monoxide dehydrogenase subunit G
MELDHSFTVPVPPDQAWNVLLDVEKVAPCMPGAQVETVNGDDVAGRLKVKVGPVSLTYKGTATFKDRDTADRSVLVEASGKEMRGAGTASATVRAALSPENSSDSGTLVTLHTTLNVTGRPAQFGRGVITEVGSRRIDKFADNLAQQLTNGGVAATAAAAGPATAGPAAAAPPASAPGAAFSAAGGDDGRQRCGRRALRRGFVGCCLVRRPVEPRGPRDRQAPGPGGRRRRDRRAADLGHPARHPPPHVRRSSITVDSARGLRGSGLRA